MATLTTSDTLHLHYETEGGGDPVLVLHGLSSSIEGNFKRPGIWDALIDSGRHVIGLDARGHGQSDKPHADEAYANGAMVRDAGELLDHLGLSDVDVVGYSMGAHTSLRFAARDRRVRRLVLGGIGGDPGQWTGSASTTAASRLLSNTLVRALDAPDESDIDDAYALHVRRLMIERGNDLAAMAAICRAMRTRTPIDLADVTAQTLVVCGDQDMDPQPLASALPRGTAEVLEGDHESVVTNPKLAHAIVTFLKA